MWMVAPVLAVPDTVIGPVVQAESPLNGTDLTPQIIAALEEGTELPGRWMAEGEVGGTAFSHLLARPVLFGREVVLLRSFSREGRVVAVEATYADAGSYFGYFQEALPEDLKPREREREMARRVQARQQEFATEMAEALEKVREELSRQADRPKPKIERHGKVRMLRAEVEEWRMGKLTARLFVGEGRLVRLVLGKTDEMPAGWMERSFDGETARERSARLAATVEKNPDGSVRVTGIRPIPQGYRPYCGLNTLAMAARHLGLMIDEDWLAAAAGFRNTGSAAGSDMVSLYHAVAAEAGMGMDRGNSLDETAVKAALAEGRPVIVWRRFCWERNKLHDRIARRGGKLPDPSSPDEKSTWPGEEAPLHASVLTGYDPGKREVFFLESWSGKDQPRRMRMEEMAATTYLCFIFENRR
jgi:hypothetical protein